MYHPQRPRILRLHSRPPPPLPLLMRAEEVLLLTTAMLLLLLLLAPTVVEGVPPPNCADATFGPAQIITIDPLDTNFVLDLARCHYNGGLTIRASSATPLIGVTIAVHEGSYSSVALAFPLVLGAGSSFIFANASITTTDFLISAWARDGATVRVENVAEIKTGMRITGSFQNNARLFLSRVRILTPGVSSVALQFGPSVFRMVHWRVQDCSFEGSFLFSTGASLTMPSGTNDVLVEFVDNFIKGSGNAFQAFGFFSTNATLRLRGNIFDAPSGGIAFFVFLAPGLLGSYSSVVLAFPLVLGAGSSFIFANASVTTTNFLMTASARDGAI